MSARRGIDRLTVVALGGNAVSPPAGGASYAAERRSVGVAARELAALARGGARLLVVHGNGPQVGRLLRAPGVGEAEQLDVHVAQTQGELGYLLAEALDAALPGAPPAAALVTRVLVDPNDPGFARPTKPVGPILAAPPSGAPFVPTPDGVGFRRVVASPRPLEVIDEDAIAALLAGRHVVAGGGGGVALAPSAATSAAPGRGSRTPRPAVVDKDHVASLLALRLGAERLVLVTDVPCASEGYGTPSARPLARLAVGEARALLARGVFAEGSMAPKVESAADFAAGAGRPAFIAALGAVDATLRGEAGTRLDPGAR